MEGTRCIKCMANGNPSVFAVTPETNVHFLVDMTGEYDITFVNGCLSIPIENAQTYEQYRLPDAELEQYFSSLLDRIMTEWGLDRTKLDICAIQSELLTQYWTAWQRMGYVHRNDPRPPMMALYAPKKKSWL